ncbi:hypothetical protein [Bythopirellula polymerisocia]|uniref:Glutathione synthetase n=1 Tax=Bythopirellula polymerisocia TaxID=2528003 RepID=A0A5C6CN37_9BACT|nr:hypothetical protein [Bythopirellula polymerisocia]TWU24761.1 glutathione synthetase [Bythopirellula polymerisocia]
MKIGLVVNVMDSDGSGATTYRLAAEAINAGHEVWVMSTGSLSYNPDDTIRAFARTVPPGNYTSEKFLEVFKSNQSVNKWITVDELDVLLLRNNPSVQKAWAQLAGIHFGRLAMRHGLIVLNDLNGLGSVQKFEKVNFSHAVLESLERKSEYMQYNRRNFSNVELATL